MSGKFSLDLSRLVQKANGQVETAVRKVMLEAFRGVVMKSPVDTGRFKSNWIVGYGTPDRTVTDDTDKGGSETVGKIAAGIQGMRIVDGVSIYCTNSLSYSLALEYGSSQQAPAGMVRTTLAEITARYGA